MHGFISCRMHALLCLSPATCPRDFLCMLVARSCMVCHGLLTFACICLVFTVTCGCRTKPKIDETKSDKEVFNGLPMWDACAWGDAKMANIFFYLYRSAATRLPDSWHATMCKFAHDLQRFVGADHVFVDAYMAERNRAM